MIQLDNYTYSNSTAENYCLQVDINDFYIFNYVKENDLIFLWKHLTVGGHKFKNVNKIIKGNWVFGNELREIFWFLFLLFPRQDQFNYKLIHCWKNLTSRLIIIIIWICNLKYMNVFLCDGTRDLWITSFTMTTFYFIILIFITVERYEKKICYKLVNIFFSVSTETWG